MQTKKRKQTRKPIPVSERVARHRNKASELGRRRITVTLSAEASGYLPALSSSTHLMPDQRMSLGAIMSDAILALVALQHMNRFDVARLAGRLGFPLSLMTTDELSRSGVTQISAYTVEPRYR